MPKGIYVRTPPMCVNMSKARIGLHHSTATREKQSKTMVEKYNQMQRTSGTPKIKTLETRICECPDHEYFQCNSSSPQRFINGHSSKGTNKGASNPNWHGGVTTLITQIRLCPEYHQWRFAVFTKDNFTCQFCNRKGIWIEAHHIKNFSLIIEENNITTFEQAIQCVELWNISNGKTLCKTCHNTTKKHPPVRRG